MAQIIEIYTKRKTAWFALGSLSILPTFVYVVALGFTQLHANLLVVGLFLALCILTILQGFATVRLRQMI